MSKILFVYERSMPTVSILQACFQNLSDVYPISSNFRQLLSITSEDVDAHDVLYLIRPDNMCAFYLAQYAHKAGKVVIVSLDDDLLNLPKSNPSMPWRRRGLRMALKNADVLVSSSPHILHKYGNMTMQKRSAQIDTIVRNDEFAPVSDSFEETSVTKIVYAANPSHDVLFNRYILPVMDELAERYEKRLQFTFVGVRPDISAYDRYFDIRYIKGMPLLEYRAFMSQERFDIGLAPLHDSEFAKCKYFNKYLEYTLSGITGIYSKVEPYTYVVKDGENGLLAENTYQAWLDTLCKAIDDSTLRKQCLYCARDHVKNNFNEQAVLSRLIDAIPEFITPAESTQKCQSLASLRIIYFLWRPLDWIYLVFFYLTRTGVSGFIKKVKTHMRERYAYQNK